VEQFFQADVARLSSDPAYGPMFEQAFGPGPITTVNAARALAQFERTLLSFGSRYDGFLTGSATLTDSEERGRRMFYSEAADCFHCHGTLMFTDNLFHNNALDTQFARGGLCDATGNPADCGKFKTPTLRNIALTAPYMHDDRFPNLETVVEFYSEQIVPSPTVDPLMKYVARGGLHLTHEQKVDLLAFLRTLTDESFTQDPALASPFP
jgi:cytochrome c peroxidase